MKELNLFFVGIALATNYYVNDNLTVNDVFCTAGVNNLNNVTSPATSNAALMNLLSTCGASLSNGDSIFMAAGTYTDKNPAISFNSISIKGLGRALTVFDNAEASADAINGNLSRNYQKEPTLFGFNYPITR
jgi:hypothetical protein